MAIDDDISFYERVPTLGLLGRQALRILAIGAESRYVHGGDVLFNVGDEADGAYVIQEGSFLLAVSDQLHIEDGGLEGLAAGMHRFRNLPLPDEIARLAGELLGK